MGKIIEVESGVEGLPLFDMYIDGKWHGSRRTKELCHEYFRNHKITEIENG